MSRSIISERYNEAEKAQMREIGSEHRLRSENLAFDFDVWYPPLRDFSFPSECIPLRVSEAAAIIHYQESRFMSRGELNLDDVQRLEELETRLDMALQSGEYPDGAFLRLCGRSPKDGDPLSHATVREAYKEELRRVRLEASEEEDETQVAYRAVLRVPWMRVTSGEAAMSLLLTSERVFADLVDWLKFGEPEQIVLRQWEPELSLDMEFRAFVYEGKLTAISQYDHYGVFKDLVLLEKKIEAAIRRKQAAMHSSVREATYCADFVYLASKDEAAFIELSPFRTCTGAACFRWGEDDDVLHGRAPFELRLNQREHPQLAEVIEYNWNERWKNDVAHYKAWYPGYNDEAKEEEQGTILGRLMHALTRLTEPILCRILTLGSRSTVKSDSEKTLIFFYGTLKKGFQWHHKYLWRARLISQNAETADPFPLVVGESGVPYLLGDVEDFEERGLCIEGEIWEVDQETLMGLDEYEGINKGHYERRPVNVHHKEGDAAPIQAQAYFKVHSSAVLQGCQRHKSYTMAMHKKLYRPIRHIEVKQELYLGDVIRDGHGNEA